MDAIIFLFCCDVAIGQFGDGTIGCKFPRKMIQKFQIKLVACGIGPVEEHEATYGIQSTLKSISNQIYSLMTESLKRRT